MANRTGYLTIFSADRAEIYGEFADSTWEIEDTDGGTNNLFSGVASEGTMEAFRRLNALGIDHVAFDFESNGQRHSGEAQLLAPGAGLIKIETGNDPVRASG